MLAFARVAGETAPLLFTALGNQYFGVNLNQPMAALAAADLCTYAQFARMTSGTGSRGPERLVLIVMIMVSVTLVRIFANRGALKGGS